VVGIRLDFTDLFNEPAAANTIVVGLSNTWVSSRRDRSAAVCLASSRISPWPALVVKITASLVEALAVYLR
jgi:hypothetical protein